MAELGIIASVVQIADVGLRLSIKLYTFGEIVASADRSVISISKDVSLTSGVLKELGQILDKDKETGTFSETAVRTADGVVGECLEVFKEMENMIVKNLPRLGAAGKAGGQGERVKRATVMLERLKWGYLQPKLELLRSNLNSLKSTLLLMLNVITYARQVAEKTESPSVIAEQKCLIEDLAHSNREYKIKFERLKLGIEGTAGGSVDDSSRGAVLGRKPSNTTKSMSGTLTRKFKSLKLAFAGTSIQDNENTRDLGSKEVNSATSSSPKAQRSITGPLAPPPNADTNDMLMNASVHSSLALPPVQKGGIPTTEATTGLDQEVLFKQLEHHSMLIKNLLKEVDEAQYKITFLSRLRLKGGIVDLHKGERRDLEKMWGLTALQSAEQRLDSLMDEIGELPRVNGFAAPVALTQASRYKADNIKIVEMAERSIYHPQEQRSMDVDVEHHHRAASLENIYMPMSAPVNETPSDTPTVTRAPRPLPAQISPWEGMRRADIAKAKAEEQTKSSTISMRKDTGDRIGGYIEPHQEEDDTGEGRADMTTLPNTNLSPSAGMQSEAIGKPRTDSATPHQPVPQSSFIAPSPLSESYSRPSTSHIMTSHYVPPQRFNRGGQLRHGNKRQAPALSQPEIEQGDSQLSDVDLVDRLVSLWTTVKP